MAREQLKRSSLSQEKEEKQSSLIVAVEMPLDLNADPPIDWDEIGEWEGPAHQLQFDMVWSEDLDGDPPYDEGSICSSTHDVSVAVRSMVTSICFVSYIVQIMKNRLMLKEALPWNLLMEEMVMDNVLMVNLLMEEMLMDNLPMEMFRYSSCRVSSTHTFCLTYSICHEKQLFVYLAVSSCKMVTCLSHDVFFSDVFF
jgi:hypothetical protein